MKLSKDTRLGALHEGRVFGALGRKLDNQILLLTRQTEGEGVGWVTHDSPQYQDGGIKGSVVRNTGRVSWV